ncbi:MAG: glycerol-3-phosphate acyltransferase [Actinobacteria bacterium]|nr:glycerol-3-phosphate acyltransferase [Actinomycetota bacterium]
MSEPVVLFLLEFLIGSLMFSYWIGKFFGKDITKVGDGNPGAYNLIQSIGAPLGFFGLALDYFKGFLPLYFIVQKQNEIGLSEIELGLIAAAPILGHAFSPFLKFRGGKALAVTFGVWSSYTKWEAPTLLGSVFTLFVFVKPKSIERERWLSFAPFAGLLALFFYLLAVKARLSLWITYLINSLIIFYKFRKKEMDEKEVLSLHQT